MSMEQVGTEKTLGLEERGYIMAGGSLSDEIQRGESIVFGTTMMISETPTKAETVLHIVGRTLSEVATRAETVVIDNT